MKLLWAVFGFLVGQGIGFLSALVSEEMGGRLHRLPLALIRLAACYLPPDVREDHAQEWVAELHEVLHGTEGLPITRLCRGTSFALGLLGRVSKMWSRRDRWPRPPAIGTV